MNFVIAFIAAVLLLLIIWSLKGVLLLPIKQGKNTSICTLVSVNGNDNSLEHTLDGLIWLRENGTLKSEIRIQLTDCDEATWLMAQRYAETRTGIKILKDGEAICPNLRK